MMDENSAGCASEGVLERIARARDIAGGCADRVRHLGLRDEAHRLDAVVELCRRALSHAVSQDVPAPAAVTAEMVRKAREAYAGSGREWPDFMAAHLNAALSAATPLQSDLAAENARLREALTEYLDAEEIDDPAIRQEELAACRFEARAALTGNAS